MTDDERDNQKIRRADFMKQNLQYVNNDFLERAEGSSVVMPQVVFSFF